MKPITLTPAQLDAALGLCSAGARAVYTLRDGHGESQEVVVCQRHGARMPPVDGERVTARRADDGIRCDFA